VFTLVFTKIDKEKPGVVKRNVEAFFNVLKESWQFLPRHFVTSAELKTGRPEMLAFIDTCNEAATAAE
jgi:GTP-binding protein